MQAIKKILVVNLGRIEQVMFSTPALRAINAAHPDSELHVLIMPEVLEYCMMLSYIDNIVVMQCNTNYTASLENFHHIALNVLKTYASEFPDVVLGLSDHTPLHSTVLGSIALGARVIEKHFTDDTNRMGPDHKFSMDPTSWNEMVERSRELELALGTTEKRVMGNEKETVILQRRAIRAARVINEGDIIDKENLVMLRPCPNDGLPPSRIDEVIGKKALRTINCGDCVRIEDAK